jgi:Holliday junction DNA helicase RuvB
MDHKKFKEFHQKFDLKLRPGNFTEFVGHKNIIERLQVVVQAAKGRGEALGHVLFHGPSGLGKTTLANILAAEMGSSLVTSTGPCIEKAGDLAGILTNLQERDFFFIDEIHRIARSVEEYLYPAMEDFSLDLMIDSGPSARSVQVSLNRFTLIGATTKIGNLSAPLRSRFGLGIRLEFYTVEALTEIIQRSAKILQIPIDEKSAKEVAIRSRGTPRLANNLLCWVRDFAQLKNANVIDIETVFAASNMAEIDHRGLDAMDKRILREIIEHHKGGPVGVKAIASSIGEDESTVADVYEPYLIMQGFIRRTPRGREVTRLAYEHLGANVHED